MTGVPVENARVLHTWAGVLLAGALSVSPNRADAWTDQGPMLNARPPVLRNSSTDADSNMAGRTQRDWKAELRARYDAMPNTNWFRQSHENKSMGDPLYVI